jgi:RHS repeat-associated protein
VSDKKEQANGVWQAVVISAKDYYPFGMSMPGRTTEGGTYRYGFNGKETDHETGIQDYGMRWYLPNIARFPSVDPLEKSYPWNSVYAFAEGNPIEFIDLDGGERKHYKIEFDQKTHKPNLTFVKQEDIVTLHPVSVAEPLSGQLEYEARTNEYEEYVLHKPITAYLWREGVDPKRMDGEVTFTTRDWNKVQNAQETDFPSSTWRWVLAQHAQNMHDAGTGGSGVSMRRNVGKSSTVISKIERLNRAETSVYRGGTNRLRPENGYKGGSKHGIKWQDGDIKAALEKSNTPLGQWGSKADLEYAGQQAYLLEPNTGFMDFPINSNTTSKVYLKDGSIVVPDMIRVRNNDNRTFHGFPIDSKSAEPIFKQAALKPE